MPFQALLAKHYITMWDKQMAFAAWLEEQGHPNWGFNMSTGKLTFGDVLALDIQLLGTESTASNSWLWAWANTMSNIPSTLLQAANTLRAYGESSHIKELMTASTHLDHLRHGHHFSLAACAVLGADAYYRGPYEGGALFMLIKDPNFPVTVTATPEHLVSTITRFASSLPVDNLRLYVVHYLEQCGMAVTHIDDVITGSTAGGSRVEVEFDRQGRLQQVNAELKPHD